MFKIIGGDQKEYGPISAEQIRQWIKDGRLNGQTPAQRDGGEWRPLGTYEEFADLFQIAGAAPSAAPSGSYPSAPVAGTPIMPGGSRESALQAIKGPAIALIVTAALGIVLYLLSAVGHAVGGSRFEAPISPDTPPQIRSFLEHSQNGPAGVAGALLGVALNVFVLLGAIKMMRLESRGMALATCIVAMVPCQCCCLLGLPFGIWALVVLNKPEIKSQFLG